MLLDSLDGLVNEEERPSAALGERRHFEGDTP